MTSSEIPSVPVQDLPAEFDAAPSAGAGSGAGAPSAILLDVREDDEWQLGHAPAALHIPMIDVPARLDELDYDADIYVVCRQGGRSIEVAKYLAYVGFEVYQVVGGMVAWQQAGRPLIGAGDIEAKIY
ncbi:rhodanese-like domain-containing protein [Nocardia violaceofusca]|uniref:rhodanese-like domain-containing protein n=1 Tax=Nocardia violaceofusca TaxID=941182 RepID=UPI000B24387D|nr:rhodanese-like domain-containing protein [Nocardia violaceofusca]